MEVRALINEVSDDVLQDINQSQLSEYKDILRQLGTHPDKVLINTLSMIAEDYCVSFPKSCSSIYQAIKDFLISPDIRPDCKLPLVYVIDSILKNVKGLYIEIMQQDIGQWMSVVYQSLQGNELARTKLRKVWNTWNECKIFSEGDWKTMGKCFIDEDEKAEAAKKITDAKTKAAGIERGADGSLLLGATLRRHMQVVLDDVQSDETDELKKVSLERLAEINPDLLVEIKKAAESLMEQEMSSAKGDISNPITVDGVEESTSSLFNDLRQPHDIDRSKEWDALGIDYLNSSNVCIKKLLNTIRLSTTSASSDPEYEQDGEPLVDIEKLLGTASASVSALTQSLERLKTQEKNKGFISLTAGPLNSSLPGSLPTFYRATKSSTKTIDPAKFTNEGLKEKNEAVIASLYEGGLPFVCSADGRRFATQIEQSNHLDELFRRNQLEKAMERTDERDWYESESKWCRRMTSNSVSFEDAAVHNDENQISDERDPDSYVMTADESKDRCAICGINFNMHFDQDEGEWKYKNCREIEVLNDDVAEEESEMMYVHVTCQRNLGVDILTRDQVQIQDY
ncbi:pre-mRNA cleavage complex 2 protein Pcf11 [Chaetoceros tenuissimus]|uniref:Pre-mRNA cleavage complex 2 protein Pcf11 n=1 Tax=Chaetoceros tenuissimus TaxID=426638 RepID=A0AAD3H6C7_9STRA|nr:pre-mRNA cleavage complex 2 protein Pcf11 [Chaetoceros tenuissimus]